MTSPFQVAFSAAQKAIVAHVEGPGIVLAGAGSGKTAVIVGRAAEMVASGIPSRNILLLTFSRKAAGEMQVRAEKLFKGRVKDSEASAPEAESAAALAPVPDDLAAYYTDQVPGPDDERDYGVEGEDDLPDLDSAPPTSPEDDGQPSADPEGLDAIESVKQSAIDSLYVDTFHAWGFRLIRSNPFLFDRKRGVTCLDESDREKVFKRLASTVDLNWADRVDRPQIKAFISFYSLLKNEGYYANPADDLMMIRIADLMERNAKWQANRSDALLKLAVAYERETADRNLVDFDDLCLMPSIALQKNPDLAERLARRFKYITVDESQDTNRVQYEIVKQIARRHPSGGNLMMIGDDDQGLFSWRGARIQNLQQFVSDFRPIQFRLEQNYRSTPEIVGTAGRLIAHNEGRLPKTPFSSNDGGKKVALGTYATGTEQATEIAKAVVARLREGVPLTEIAVLYRTNRLSRMIEPALRARGVPTVVVGGASLYDSLEIKAALGGARLLANPRDLQALAAVSEYIKGLGAAGIEKIGSVIREMGPRATVWDAGRVLTPAVRGALFDLQRRLDSLAKMGPESVGAWVAAKDGLNLEAHYAELIQAKPEQVDELEAERDRRLGNLASLDDATAALGGLDLPAGAGFDQDDTGADQAPAAESVWEMLIEAHLTGAATEQTGGRQGQKREAVTLSTIHRAKGLEWDVVYVAGFSEGIMPLVKEVADVDDEMSSGGIEEERRLGYVALTRARKICALFHSSGYGHFGPQQTALSRFVKEMQTPLQSATSPVHALGKGVSAGVSGAIRPASRPHLSAPSVSPSPAQGVQAVGGIARARAPGSLRIGRVGLTDDSDDERHGHRLG